MELTDFDRRIAALGTQSRAVDAARDVLVDGEGYKPSAAKHGIDPGYLHRLCRQIESVEICAECGQVK